MVVAGIVCTEYFRILGWVLNQLGSTGIFPLITTDRSQGHNKKKISCISAFPILQYVASLLIFLTITVRGDRNAHVFDPCFFVWVEK